ncbi:hypothetical protein MHTCC0001_01680 [Flavobacteriaceae bacterium MHTCC 0001]
MKLLSKTTPAETLLIKDCNSAKLKDLMKLTFMDLLLKKVIKIIEVDKKAHSRDKYIRTYTYLIAGKNFKIYKPKKHELIYLSPFEKNESIQILLKHFIKMAYDFSNGSWSYKKSIRGSKEINLYFKDSFLSNLFRQVQLTNNGDNVKNQISNYLNDIDKEIVHLLHNDKEKALELLLNIGGNIFLLKNLDFQLLKEIDKNLINQKRTGNTFVDDSDSDIGVWSYMDFFEDDFEFDSCFDSFDSAMDSFDSEFDASGCSSYDSGCSSCGGCGGCD